MSQCNCRTLHIFPQIFPQSPSGATSAGVEGQLWLGGASCFRVAAPEWAVHASSVWHLWPDQGREKWQGPEPHSLLFVRFGFCSRALCFIAAFVAFYVGKTQGRGGETSEGTRFETAERHRLHHLLNRILLDCYYSLATVVMIAFIFLQYVSIWTMCHISNINALYIPAEARIWSCHSFSFSKSEYVKFFKLIGGKESFKASEAIFVRHWQIGDKLW